MKFIAQIQAVDENVFRNFGCAMVIGKILWFKKKIFKRKLFYFSDCDDGSDEQQRYCGMYNLENFILVFLDNFLL